MSKTNNDYLSKDSDGVTVIDTSIFLQHFSNSLSTTSIFYKNFVVRNGRPPVIEDLDSYHKSQWEGFKTFGDSIRILKQAIAESKQGINTPIHMRLMRGARKGSIVRVLNPDDLVKKTNPNPDAVSIHSDSVILWGSKIEMADDAGKVISLLMYDDSCTDHNKNIRQPCHEILIGYTGPCFFIFKKKPREVKPAVLAYDINNKLLEVGDWILDSRFKLHRISKISDAGSLYLTTPAQVHHKTQTKMAKNVLCRTSKDCLKVDPPEAFDSYVAMIDYDLSAIPLKLAVQY